MNHTNGGWARKYSAAISFAVVGALLVTGCSSEPKDPMTSPPATVSPPSATAVKTVVPPPTTPAVYKPATDQGPAENVPVPVLPEKAKEFSKEGLIAFAEYWYETLSYAYETGSVGPMQKISDAACPSCLKVKESVERQYGAGGWLVGGRMVVHQSDSTFHKMDDGSYQAVLTIQQMQVTAYGRDGTAASPQPQSIARPDIVIATHTDGRWKTLQVEHLTKE